MREEPRQVWILSLRERVGRGGGGARGGRGEREGAGRELRGMKGEDGECEGVCDQSEQCVGVPGGLRITESIGAPRVPAPVSPSFSSGAASPIFRSAEGGMCRSAIPAGPP